MSEEAKENLDRIIEAAENLPENIRQRIIGQAEGIKMAMGMVIGVDLAGEAKEDKKEGEG